MASIKVGDQTSSSSSSQQPPIMELDLPGFRFHPTEEELLDFYLKRMIHGNSKLPFEIIATINLYRYNPWELPGVIWFQF